MFNKRLRSERMRAGLTQQKLSDALNVSLVTLQKYEQGTREPSFDCLVRIADILDTSTDYLLGRDDWLKSHAASADESR